MHAHMQTESFAHMFDPAHLSRPLSRRRFRSVAILLASLLAITAAVTGTALPASAVSEPTLSVLINQTTGTGPFDADDLPGHDAGPDNDIVRTNDLINYKIEVHYENGDGNTPSTNTTFTVDLPQGTYLDALPATCGSGSSITPPTIPAPPVPLTATSWQSLPSQQLVCNVGEVQPGSTLAYPVSAKVLGWVPDGTQLDPASPTVTNDEIVKPVPSTNQVQATVSAAPQWDLSKNNTSPQENTGFYYQSRVPCSYDSSKSCLHQFYPILLSAPVGGKGTTPLLSPIRFVDDVSPASLWGAAGATITDLAKYGARLVSCTTNIGYNQTPGGSIGGPTPSGPGTEVNSVRDSGTNTCSQPGGPGTPINVTITDADTSLFTFPTERINPPGQTIPGDAAYAISSTIGIEIPADTIKDYGTPSGDVTTLSTRNVFRDLDVSGLDGTQQPPSEDPTWNNYRENQTEITAVGAFTKHFTGVPGVAANTPEREYNPDMSVFEGPPGGFQMHSGQIPAAPTQEVISMLWLAGGGPGDPTISTVACDTWDPTLLQLVGGNVPPSTTDHAASRYTAMWGSGGEPAWLSGVAYDGMTPRSPVLPTRVQYSNGGGSAATSECESVTWYDDPAMVPGNDPVLEGQQIYTGVSRVRVWIEIPPNSVANSGWAFISIHQRVAPGVTKGERIPNWAGVLFDRNGSQSMVDMLNDPALDWRESTYDPGTNTGQYGDRLIAAPAFSRIKKYIQAPGAPDYVLGAAAVPQVTGGQTVKYRLNATLNSAAAATNYTTDVSVEDCLPQGQSLVEASSIPDVVADVSPAGAGLTCAAGETYVRWDLGGLVPNQPIAPIFVEVVVSETVPSGTYTNTTLVTSADEDNTDAKDKAARTSEAQVQVVQSEGIKINKAALTPIVEVNRADEVSKDPLRWRIDLANINSESAVSNPDVIDQLPQVGVRGTDFNGSLEFVSANQVGGNDVDLKFWYTAAPGLVMDPTDPSNARGGSTVWCDAPAAGQPVWRSAVGDPATTADCPATASEVTGVRIRKGDDVVDVPFPSGSVLSVVIEMLPTGNRERDIYNNCVTGRVKGLVNSVGPLCAKEVVVASSIGDRVWLDADGDGVQDAEEKGLAGIRVTLAGADTDGNPVTLTTVTDATGDYDFMNLQAGDYTVTFDPAGLTRMQWFTLQDQGTDDSLDSDGDPVTGVTRSYTVGVDVDELSVDQGVREMHPAVSIVKFINGDDADAKPGVQVAQGSAMAVTMKVTNTGDVTLDPVVVTDDKIAASAISCPQTRLAAGESMTCTASYPAPAPGVQHTNTATVVGTPAATPNNSRPDPVTDDNPANAFVPKAPAVTIVKYINGEDANTAPGVTVPNGSTMQIKLVVTNSGNLALDPVVVSDDKIAASGISCPQTRLAVGESMTCAATLPSPAPGVQHTNTATVLGITPDGSQVTDEDPANAVVKGTPGISIVKSINGEDADQAPGVAVEADSDMAVTMLVTNTGDITLDPVVVTDDTIDADDIDCPRTALAPGESMTCAATLPAPELGVQHTNIATVTGETPGGVRVTDDNPAHAHAAKVLGDSDQDDPGQDPRPGDGDGDHPGWLPNTGASSLLLGMALLAIGLLGIGGVIVRRSLGQRRR